MRLVGISLIAAICVIGTFADKKADVELEEKVLVLTEANFDQVIESTEHILVEFYAPWCGHCKSLAPEYAKAATTLEDQQSPVKLGKVDATIHMKLAERYGVKGYPTLKFFRNGSPIDYNGGRDAAGIIAWVTKKSGPPAKTVTTVEEAKKLIGDTNVIVFGFFKDVESEAAKVFLNVANTYDNHVFAIVHAEEIFTEYGVPHNEGKVILFKQFDEGKVVHEGEIELKALQEFVYVYSLPLVVDFNQDTAKNIFGGEIKNHLLVFLSQEAGHYDQYVEAFKETAKKFRNNILFVTIDVDKADHGRILEFFGMTMGEVPGMRIINLEQDMSKYKPEISDLTADNIQNFVQAFFDGKLSKHLLSQEIPEDWDKAPVKVLVAKNFNEVVFDKTKDVLVEFYAPWCGHCKQLAPIFDQLGEKFKDKADVLIAKMDATANELDGVKIESFPTITLYKKGDNELVEYDGDRSLENLSKFVESGGLYSQESHDAEEEDEDDDAPRKDEL